VGFVGHWEVCTSLASACEDFKHSRLDSFFEASDVVYDGLKQISNT
jgi:hypothetical protein